MAPTDSLLDVSSDWPETQVQAGEQVLTAGGSNDRLLVLVEGSLEVRRGDEIVATINQPGACVGEIALLLGDAHTADVVATAPSRLRSLENASTALASDAALLLPVATTLASRLRLVTAYLADLRSQYADSSHSLSMVSEVLGSLTQHHGAAMEPGSERELEAPY
jgi:CRP-like cAMP-binding protein